MLTIGSNHGQSRKLVEIDIVIQTGQARLLLIILDADNHVLRLHIAGIAQRPNIDANNAFYSLRYLHFAPALSVITLVPNATEAQILNSGHYLMVKATNQNPRRQPAT